MNDLAEEVEATFRAHYKGILSLLEEISKKNNLDDSQLALKNFLNNLPGDKQKARAVLGIYREITEDEDRYSFIAYNKEAIPKGTLAIIVERILEDGSPFYHSLIEGIILQGIYSLGDGIKGVSTPKQLEEEWNLDALSIIFEALEKAEKFYYENEEAFKNKGQSYQLDYGATAQSFQDRISQRIDKRDGYRIISQLISKVSTTHTRHGTIRRFLYGIQMRIAGHVSIDDRRDLLLKVMYHYPPMLCSYNRSKIGAVFQSFVMKNKDEKGMVEDLRSALKKLYEEQYITEESLTETLSLLPAESPVL